MTSENDEQAAREHLKRAQELHTEGRIDEALQEARRAVDAWLGFVEAWMYAGTTLVTRKLAFREGLAALERALALAPDDPGVNYSLGWCYEFVAYRLEKQATTPYRNPLQLYGLAAHFLQRCIELQPEQGLLEDAEDLLASIEPKLE